MSIGGIRGSNYFSLEGPPPGPLTFRDLDEFMRGENARARNEANRIRLETVSRLMREHSREIEVEFEALVKRGFPIHKLARIIGPDSSWIAYKPLPELEPKGEAGRLRRLSRRIPANMHYSSLLPIETHREMFG